MNQIFIKPSFKKSTKNQIKKIIPTVPKSDSTNSSKLAWRLFQSNINPICDLLRNDPTTAVQEIFTDSSSDEITLDPKQKTHYIIVVKPNHNKTITLNCENNCIGAEIFIQSHAKLKLIILQHGKQKNHLGIITQISAKGEAEYYLNSINGEENYTFIQNKLIESHATSNIFITAHTKKQEKGDLFIGNCFDAQNCTGEIIAKTVVADKSKLSFVGEIEITLKGKNTNSYLKEDVLMLDDSALIEAIPSLEIKTNDVKAGHGVSISKLTDDKLFYLTSRGISTKKARKLVLKGFLKEIYNKTNHSPTIKLLDKLIK